MKKVKKILLTIIGIVAVSVCMSVLASCSQDDDFQETNSIMDVVTDVKNDTYLQDSPINTISYVNEKGASITRSDVCSGPGGSSISITGNKVLSQGKHIISLNMSSNSNWTYGFTYLCHQVSPTHTGDVYWRVVKRRKNTFSNDDYEVFRDCTLLTPNQSDGDLFTTSQINTGPKPWTHIQLEIVVVGGSARVAWTGYNGRPI